MRRIETISGKVMVEYNDKLYEVRYNLSVQQEEMSNPALKDPAIHKVLGEKSVKGTVKPVLDDAYNNGERLTLALDDGRQVNFVFTDHNGSISGVLAE